MRLYEPRAYAQASGLQSYWSQTAERPAFAPLDGELRVDVVIVGAGYAGLNAARRLAREHGRSVAVLDAHWPGWGASGRNGGFCCIGGGMLESAQVAKRWGTEPARAFARTQREAIEHVRALLYDEGIDAGAQGAGELCLAHSARAARGFAAEAQQWSALHGVRAELWSAARARERGARIGAHIGAHIGRAEDAGAAGLYVPLGFGLNPWRYVQGLANACQRAGVQLFADSPVQRLAREAGGWCAHTSGGRVRAEQLLVATNGYSSDALPPWLAARYLPVLSSIAVTRPLSTAERAAQGFDTDIMCYDSRRLLHYFRRLDDGRVLFGGRGAIRASAAGERGVERMLRRDFEQLFPAWTGVEFSHVWSGLVCLNGHLQPFVGALPESPGAFAAFGWHGNGVAMASHCGALVADQMAGGPPLCGPLSTAPGRFPLGRHRRALLTPLYALAQGLDRWW